jgi:hypothetical protein
MLAIGVVGCCWFYIWGRQECSCNRLVGAKVPAYPDTGVAGRDGSANSLKSLSTLHGLDELLCHNSNAFEARGVDPSLRLAGGHRTDNATSQQLDIAKASKNAGSFEGH